jgi:hypothetical protein
MQPTKTRSDLWMDLILVAFLIGFDVTARILPHAAGVWPVAASALFAGRVLRRPMLAVIVPTTAIVLSDLALAPDDWRVSLVVCAAATVPAFAGMLARRGGMVPVVIGSVASSLLFFMTTNFAVWIFGNMYPATPEGLAQCYVAALPFLDRTVLGDLFWVAAFFGGGWMVQRAPAVTRRPQ